MIPSRKMIYLVQQRLYKIGDIINPFKIEGGYDSEAIQFDEKKMVPLLFKTYGIHDETMNNSV